MRTLADMTPEERANCPGMWAGTFTGYTGVIVYENGKQAYLIIPEFNREQTFPLDKVTPRADLPRAWQADGQPLEADWQYAEYQPGINRGFYTIEETIEKGPEMAEGTTAARRWVGEWEEA